MVSKAQGNQSQIQECPPSSIWFWLLNLKYNHFQLHKWQRTNCPSFYCFKDGHLSYRKQTIANAALILYSRDQTWNQNSTATKMSDFGQYIKTLIDYLCTQAWISQRWECDIPHLSSPGTQKHTKISIKSAEAGSELLWKAAH